MTESLYRAYERDRIGSWFTEAMTHEQIAKDGVYGELVDSFGQRFDEERAVDRYSNPVMHGGWEPRF